MKALRIRTGEAPVEFDLLPDASGSTLSALQREVDGYIECCSFVLPGVAVYINEEGKINGKCLPNRAVYATRELIDDGFTQFQEGDLIDIIFGDFVCVGENIEEGIDIGLTDEQTLKLKEMFSDTLSGMVEYFRIKFGGCR